MGGTEYVIQLYCKYFNKDHFDVKVVCLHEGGERVKLIREMGIKVIILNKDLNRLPKLLQEADVFHWHGQGWLNPEVFSIVKNNRPKLVIQTNVFGEYYDSTFYDTIDYDLYVSKMILIRRMLKDKNLKDNFAAKRKALSNPVDVDHIDKLLPTDDQIQKIKQENDLQNYFIIGRIGRADNAKFDLITLDGFAKFSSQVTNARFLLVGLTANILAHAKKLNIIDKLIIFENTLDMEKLLTYYKLMDIYLAASELGESFGMVIAEAMTAGIPVVTISTEDRDNAQIELVDNGQTGLVVERDEEKIASALFFLYKNEKVRTSLALASRLKVVKEYKADKIVKSLENLIYRHFNINNIPLSESLIVNFSQEIVNDYARRCLNLWEPEIKLKD